MGRVIGIDLGTTNSVVATPDMGSGKPRALRTCDHTFILTSLLAWKDDRWVVGQRAENVTRLHRNNVVRSSKRFIGLAYDNKRVTEDIERLRPLAIVPAPSGETGVRFDIEGQLLSPVDVAAHILRQLKQDAELQLNEPVTHAVITTPAYFDTAQNEATRRAGEAAGLIVQRIIEEPLAAVLSYAKHQSEDIAGKRVLVYDLGGGTFDVTLGTLVKDDVGITFAETTKAGDKHLGGDDFDARLEQFVIDKVLRQSGVNLLETALSVGGEAGLGRFKYELWRACRGVKEDLSTRSNENVNINDLFEQAQLQPPRRFDSVVVSRDEFERLIEPLVDNSMKLAQRALRAANLAASEIDHVLLVGGSTYIPLVRRQLQELFGVGVVRADPIDPMLVVGEGAAVLAGSLPVLIRCPKCRNEVAVQSARCRTCGAPIDSSAVAAATGLIRGSSQQVEVLSTLPVPIGIAIDSGAFDVVIPAGTTYSPTSGLPSEPFKKTYYIREDSQRYVLIECYEGERPQASENRYLGQFRAGPLPTGVHQGDELIIALSLNGDRLISGRVVFRDVSIPWTMERDQWKIRLIEVLDDAQALLESNKADPMQSNHVKTLVHAVTDLIREADADPNKGRILTTELEGEIRAAKIALEDLPISTIGELRSCLHQAQTIGELGETWTMSAPQVADPDLRSTLEHDSRQLELLRSARDEGRRAEALRDESGALRSIDRLRGLLSSLRVVYRLVLAEVISQHKPEPLAKQGAQSALPMTLQGLKALPNQGSKNGKPVTRGQLPTQEDCVEQLQLLLARMRQTILSDNSTFYMQLERMEDLLNAFFQQER